MSTDTRWSITNDRTVFRHGAGYDVNDLPDFPSFVPPRFDRLVDPPPLDDIALVDLRALSDDADGGVR